MLGFLSSPPQPNNPEDKVCKTLDQARAWFIEFRAPYCKIEFEGKIILVDCYPDAVAIFNKTKPESNATRTEP